MTTRWWMTLFLFVLLCGAGSQATPPQKVVYQQDVLIPAYGGSYCASDDLLKQILEEVKGLREDVKGLKTGQQGTQEGAVGILASRCLACHKADVADAKGGSFVLVEKDGSLAELSLAEKRRITRLVSTGKMPPTGKLPDAEVKVLSEFFAPEKEKSK